MFQSNPIRTVVKLFVLSLVVGLILRWLDVTPLDLIEDLGENARQFFQWLRGFLGWAVEYVLLGAVIVVPLWLIMVLVSRFRR